MAHDTEDGEGNLVDSPSTNALSRNLFLARIRKGSHCDGVPVNNGTGLLQCCKARCRDVFGDQNNCGRCGHKCGFGELCCHGTCTNIVYNDTHCGECNRKCLPGIKCEYGTCGYA
ncbi:PREDICTED: protein GRIM REAPER-like [Nelumbo nucifera]|uniref:Protein GRIM REAPER-like n=1 Tax=Nelumbo nucifera TaxID=4432 RepID=A0A1U8AWS2_NELNU|nr:PREDICTED: protein GRIM REAPER-like [Nelumbo nucifera]